MIHVDVSSPRNALQIVNAFIQSWWLAKKREFSGSGTQRAGGLLEGTITKHPVTLAVVCALKVDYPHFYNKLQEEPDLITQFTDVFVQQSKEFEDLPPKPKHLLSEYCKESQLLPEHTLLRRFIGSLRGLRWPDLHRSQKLTRICSWELTRRNYVQVLTHLWFFNFDFSDIVRFVDLQWFLISGGHHEPDLYFLWKVIWAIPNST